MKNLMLIVEAIRLVASAIKEIKQIIAGFRTKKLNKQIKNKKKELSKMDKVASNGPSKENDEELKKLFRKLHNIASK